LTIFKHCFKYRFMDSHESQDRPARARLLEVAERLFLEKGYERVSVRALTEAAGVNVAAINYHFQSKSNLYREVFRLRLKSFFQPRLQAMSRSFAVQGLEPPAIVRTYVAEFLGTILFSRETANFLQMVSNELSAGGAAADILVDELAVPLHNLLKEKLRQSCPAIPEDRLSLCISSISGQIFHFVRAKDVIQALTGREYDENFLRTLVDHITDFSCRGLEGYR